MTSFTGNLLLSSLRLSRKAAALLPVKSPQSLLSAMILNCLLGCACYFAEWKLIIKKNKMWNNKVFKSKTNNRRMRILSLYRLILYIPLKSHDNEISLGAVPPAKKNSQQNRLINMKVSLKHRILMYFLFHIKNVI